MMKFKLAGLIIMVTVMVMGCQKATPDSSTPTLIPMTPTHVPTLTPATAPTSSPEPFVHQPEIISKKKLSCSSPGSFTKCVDDVLNIEFEYPTVWGEIEAVLRTGGYSGYAYDYYFGGKTIAETEPLVAGGRSKDFSEGRGGISTDFAGYGDAGMQIKGSCDPNQQDLFPVCQKVSSNVAWMIRFPNAEYICNSAPGFYSTPVFRIEVDLPDNPKINGFVFEAPFYSEQFFNEVKSELYPLLGLDTDMMPGKCDDKSMQAFNARLMVFIDKLMNKSADNGTLKKLDELKQLASSIVSR